MIRSRKLLLPREDKGMSQKTKHGKKEEWDKIDKEV
jgi:hypothetical protein